MSFDLKARTWDSDPEKRNRASLFAVEITGITAGSIINKALEFGCGTGLVSFNLKDKIRDIVLADNSRGMLEVLNEKINSAGASNMTIYHLNESNPLISAGTFDLVYTLLAIHHVKDLDRLFYDFGRIINPGGWLIIGDLYTEDGSFHINDPDFDGHRGFDPEDLKRRIIAEGFENLSIRTLDSIKKVTGSLVKEYPLFVLYGRKH